jgi:hypothetical protein
MHQFTALAFEKAILVLEGIMKKGIYKNNLRKRGNRVKNRGTLISNQYFYCSIEFLP